MTSLVTVARCDDPARRHLADGLATRPPGNVTNGPAAPGTPARQWVGRHSILRGAMGHYTDVIDDLKEPTRSLRNASPEVWAGFAQLHNAAVADGVLPAKVKELMALAIAVVKRCDGCIAYHARAAARRGATPEEVSEALGVALLMDGGTASVYAPRAWSAYREFERPRQAEAATG
jgi:AhpD family alkylhydroperoxidase